MAEATPNRIAREYAQKHPDEPTLTLAKRIYAKHKPSYNSLEHARGCVRSVRGNRGDKQRKKLKDKSLYRESGDQSDRPKLPPSKSKKWEPYDMPGRNVLVMSDIHIPYHDERAVETAVQFAKKEHAISSVLINGDGSDMHTVSRWERAPDEADLRGELNASRSFAKWLRAEFPRKRIAWKKGNHEEWLDKYYWRKAPELFGIPNVTFEGLMKVDDDLSPIAATQRFDFIGEQRPINIGKLTVFHGHELPKGLTNAVNPARGAFLRMTDTVLVGHHHRSSSHTEYTWDKKPIACWSTGCLCDMSPEYARINKWNLGFAVVETDKDGGFRVYNYKMMGKNYDLVTA